MPSIEVKLTDRPGSQWEIGKALFGPSFEPEQLNGLQSYFKYYTDELLLLRAGFSGETWQTKGLAVTTYEDIFFVVDTLKRNGDAQRPAIRDLLRSKFAASDDTGLNRSTNLAIRLWLMINMQESEFEGTRHEASCVQWDDETTLRTFCSGLFPRSRWEITARSSRLVPYFTAAFMKDVCGLEIEWTTSLHDHLRLNRRRNEKPALKIFPYKCHLQALIESYDKGDSNTRVPIPLKVLIETKLSLHLLFPFWDNGTIALLKREGQTFHEDGPFESTKALNLLAFDYWRDRLLELHEEIFQAPPVSWAQLWRDRRNPQQFWTFWVALMILLLTIVSTAGTIVQAWASVKALRGTAAQ